MWWNIQIDIIEENKTYLNYRNPNYFNDNTTTKGSLDIYETDDSLGPSTPKPETMADGNTSETTASRETKMKMKVPTPFSGKREDLQKFLQEIKINVMLFLFVVSIT